MQPRAELSAQSNDSQRAMEDAARQPMRAYVILDGRFTSRDGAPASYNMHYDGFFSRYLDVFEEVVVVGRQAQVEDSAAKPVTGPRVSFLALPNFTTEREFVFALPRILATLWRITSRGNAYFLRAPGLTVGLFSLLATFKRVPFAAEVMADPFDDFAPGATNHPLRVFYRELYVRPLKFICRRASVVAYVTRDALQRRYPRRTRTPEFVYTNLNLRDAALARAPRAPATFRARPLRLVNVAVMQKLIKGQDIAIEALAKVRSAGVDAELTLVGDGSHRGAIEAQVDALGLREHVHFTGLLPSGEAVWKQLDAAHLFVLASRQEGLPRAMIEAMARGLPCIGADVGGVSELLDAECVVASHSADALAQRILAHADDPEWFAGQSRRNLAEVEQYRFARVREDRRRCYTTYRAVVEAAV